ncbi:alpha/beta hydrolase [Paradevosia shaoguanensis]|uniref:alpha/beta hydrolase n=1 Tax=Paradevosia shaoguanensis TaxID=1335043 RepID=UPI003C76F14F
MSDYVYRQREGAEAFAPALFLFHGTGGDENQFFDLGQHLIPGARLIAPRGDVSEGGAARYFRRTGEGVYDMTDLGRAVEKMTGFVKARVAEGQPRETTGLGYSNGANILASVAFEHPELFDRLVLMHPLIPFAPNDASGLAGRKVLITAGRRDPIAPAAETQKLADYFTRQGAEVTLHWHEGGHELRQDELAAIQLFLQD